MQNLLSSLKLLAVTLLVCSVAYPALLWGIGRALFPAQAEGSLIRAEDGRIVGSHLIAQGFASPGYFWPRASAVDWNGAATGGSNLSPANPALAQRAAELLERPGMVQDGPVPAELVLASGSGLDPHITEGAARYQVPRIAAARGVPAERIERLVEEQAFDPGLGLAGLRLVNVLELNLALDGSSDPSSHRTLDREP